MTEFTTPVGRIVQGNLYKGNDRDFLGNPLVFKSGSNAGQPRVDYYFALAIPKNGEADWKQTEWGKMIVDEATRAFPNGQPQQPNFNWKIIDGDSTVPDSKGTPPVNKPGFKGCWVMKLNSSFKPTIVNRDGTQQLTEEGLINLGDYIQVRVSVKGNNSPNANPGVLLNHIAVAFIGYGERIVLDSTPDFSKVGFGQAPLPPGVMDTPPEGNFAQAQVQAPQQPQAAPAVPPVPAVLQPPTAQQPAKRMTAKAKGATYEQMIAAGWTDELLIQHGYMEAF